MEILFVASVIRHITRFHIPYIKLFQKWGYKVCVAANINSCEELKVLVDLEVLCIDVPFDRNIYSKNNLFAYKQIKNILMEKNFEIIHTHTPIASFLTRVAYRKIRKGKLLYTAHGFHFYKGAPLRNWVFFYTAEKIARKWTDGIIVLNKEDYLQALKLGYKKNEAFLVHGVGVTIPKLEKNIDSTEIRKRIGLSKETVVVSYIAELNNNKNHQFLLRNWKKITDKCPDTVLLIIGSGEKENELKEYVNKNKLNVLFLGYRNDVRDILKITDIVSLLSIREGLPRSIMEAMSEKKPCIVTNSRGLRDLVIHNENGYVVEHNCDSTLQKSFISLIIDEKKRIKMGENGFRIIRKFEMGNVLKEYEHVYKRYLNTP